MTYPVFPVFLSGKKPDSSKFEEVKTDPAMRVRMDGGYTVTRARHTRKPTRSFKIGYTFMNAVDKLALDTFYDNMRGGSLIFDWKDPATNITYQARFGGPINYKHVGSGNTRRWDCSFEIEQA